MFRLIVGLSLALLWGQAIAQQIVPTEVPASYFSGLKWREIGPFRGGRSVAVSGVVGRPNEFYMGTTGGGVWKSTNAGEDWSCVSDGFFDTASIGAIAVSASNPDVVYVGTGETCIRGNITHGDGVYKSTDGGKTWSKMGLVETRSISRIRIHPQNPDIVYVGALGHVYGKNNERGLFKSTDGGKTWTKILYESDRAGVIDLSMDAKNPDVLYAATWEAWRTPFLLNSGGPGSKLFKSTDAGKTWNELTTKKGMPSGTIGRIGVSVSPANPSKVYAIVEAIEGGVFRSDDAGETWQLVNDNRNYRQRAWYYTHIFADPKDENTIYVLNVGFGKSTDGGKTFSGISVPHSDNHDLWIDPNDPKRMINANDGGGNVSVDGGRQWTAQDYATAQFYHVSTDNAFPYRVLGAQQDNSTVRIPSRTQTGGISRQDWTSTAGGESGYVVAKPNDPDIVYGGSYGGYLERLNHANGQSRMVTPWPDNPIGRGAIDMEQRFQWTFPIVFSPHDPNVLYTCSQFVLRSTNQGHSWTKISPDLTRNDPKTLGPSGGPITKDNTGVEYYATVFTLAESPRKKGLLWAGSDDGLVHITQDGGGTWTKVTPSGMPEWGLCSMIEASPHDEAVAYLAVDNHENDDLRPYIFKTQDYGKSWHRINGGIPPNVFVRVVREDPVRKGMLYAGTESGVYVSFDGGEFWQSLQLNLPKTPIHDLVVKGGDIVVATHGRSFWILDDATPLRELGHHKTLPDLYLFQPQDAYRVRWGGGGFGGGRRGRSDDPVAPNPPSGVVVSYYLNKAVDKAKLEILDEKGVVVMTREDALKEKGWHRLSVFPAYPSYKGFDGMIMWAAFSAPIVAPPGRYQARLTAGSHSQTKTFRWLRDPRSEGSDADAAEQFDFAMMVVARVTEANEAVKTIRDIKKKITEATGKAPDLKADGESVALKLTLVEEELYQVKNKSGQDPLNYPIKLNNRLAALLGVVLSDDFPPTQSVRDVFGMLSTLLDRQLETLRRTLTTDLAAFNQKLKDKKLEPIQFELKGGS